MALQSGPQDQHAAAASPFSASPRENVVPIHVDTITRFMGITETDDTPYLFRKWSAIALVAGCLERRVWAHVGNQGGEIRKTYPNLYVFLVGAPGVGKYIVNVIRELWRSTIEPGTNKGAFKVADSNMTKASMIDALADSTRAFLPPMGSPYEYNSLLVAAEEFGVFLPQYDMNFIAVLNEIYNAPPTYSERRRYGPARDVAIDNPLLNILGGLQPVWMNSTFPPEAFGMGLFSRVIMVYANSGEPSDPFANGLDRPIERHRLMQNLSHLSQLYGEVKWSPEAQVRLRDWHLKNGPPTPTHSRLEHYCRRRTQHAIKLSLISSVSRTGKVGFIEKIDVDRAIEWLIEAEKFMPDIFRAMIGQSDSEIIEELYNHLVSLYGMARKAPINERSLFLFLLKRVPSEKIPKILEAAERSNMIARIGGTDTYIPRERKEFAE